MLEMPACCVVILWWWYDPHHLRYLNHFVQKLGWVSRQWIRSWDIIKRAMGTQMQGHQFASRTQLKSVTYNIPSDCTCFLGMCVHTNIQIFFWLHSRRFHPLMFDFSAPLSEWNETKWDWTNGHTRKDAFAAVTVPWGLTKAGFNLAICSGLETRIPLSAVTVCVRPKTKRK